MANVKRFNICWYFMPDKSYKICSFAEFIDVVHANGLLFNILCERKS
jgi:hypothetical protein